MIEKAINKSFELAAQRGWGKTYWAIDIHETIVEPNWKTGEIPTKFYPESIETLQLLSRRSDIVRILYTSSHPYEIEQYLDLFKKKGIHFDYVNENPEVHNSGYGCYTKKPYFNVLIEDKAGFDANYDWSKVKNTLLAHTLNNEK